VGLTARRIAAAVSFFLGRAAHVCLELIEIIEIEIDLSDFDLQETRMATEKVGSLGCSTPFRYRWAP
jgi:hypothetical protein